MLKVQGSTAKSNLTHGLLHQLLTSTQNKLKKTDNDKEDYILEVIKSDMAEPGDEDVFKKVKNDLSQAGLNNMDEEIRNKMNEFMESAKKAIS